MPCALITGITGQDGSYLADLLLAKGYQVHGMVRRTSSLDRSRIRHLFNDPSIYNQHLFLHYADLDDPTTLRRILTRILPDELYHLAGQSHVGLSFDIPESTCNLTAMGTLRLLEIIRDLDKKPRLFHASSSEIFGRPDKVPQDETTPVEPVTPYGCAKAFASRMVSIYRNSFDLFHCNGIMFNHESERRGENFISRKICRAAAAIKKGDQTELKLGDISAKRDWGYAPDYVQGMWLMLQQDQPGDYILATGELHSIEDLLNAAFETVNLDWRNHVVRDERFVRLYEPANLVGNPAKAEKELGWHRTRSFEHMIRAMTQTELD